MTVYTTQAIASYNASPPSDDGAQTESNRGTWDGVKTKLSDPVKTLAEAINTQLIEVLNTNANVTSVGLSPALFYGFRANASADQTIATGISTPVTIQFPTEIFDANNNFASNTYTIPATGFYFFSSRITLNAQAAASTFMVLSIRSASEGVIGRSNEDFTASAKRTQTACAGAYLTAADTITVDLSHDEGSNLVIDGNNSEGNGVPYFCGWRVS